MAFVCQMKTYLKKDRRQGKTGARQLVPWTTGTMPFLTWVDNWDHFLNYSYTGTISV